MIFVLLNLELITLSVITLLFLALLIYSVYQQCYKKGVEVFTKHKQKCKEALLNMSYSPGNKENVIKGYGRRLKDGTITTSGSGHTQLFGNYRGIEDDSASKLRLINLPKSIKDDFIGEVKGFILNGDFYINSHFWGARDSLDIFPSWASKRSKELYFKSKYKNFLWNVDKQTVVPLFYDVLPSESFTNKNFLFFEDTESGKYLVITSVSPHRIYELDPSSGYMQPYSQTQSDIANYFLKYNYKTHSLDEFNKSGNLCLSGGPIKIPERNCYLVAGHLGKGGWGGFRMTFFYTFSDKYPFEIISVSNPISFGFSDTLEYCNQIFRIGDEVYISLGVKDRYSVLLQAKLEDILELLNSPQSSSLIKKHQIDLNKNT